MSRFIEFTYNDKKYTLEFNRKTAAALEAQGFVANDVLNKPNLYLTMLFKGAFAMHHPYIRPDVVDEIFSHIGKRTDLVGKLAALYSAPIEDMLADTDEDGDEGNIQWGANF